MHVRVSILATALAAVACNPSLDVPPGAQISCTQDADCPADYRCNPDTQLCASRQESPPASAPALVLPSGQAALKNGDLLSVGGTCESGAKVSRVRLVNASTGAELQSVPVTSVASADGALSGSFLASGLPDGASVALEVVVQARGFLSAPENSRSLPATVDLTPPAAATVGLQGGANVVSAPGVTLALSAVGATEMYVDGDVADGPAVRQWLPYGTSADASLTAGDATKVLLVRYRDGAHNEVQASGAVELNTHVPRSQPILIGPKFPIAKVRNGDTVTVQGSAEAGTILYSALLLSTDAAGTPLTGSGCSLDVTSQVTLGPGGNFGGSFSIGTPCAGAAAVALQVLVINLAGTRSIPEQSRSGTLALDNQAPQPALASLQAVALSQPGYSRLQDVVLLLDAELDGTVQVLVDGDVQAGARVRAWVDFPGTQTTPGQEPVTLTATDGSKLITVTFRDELGNTTAPIPVNVILDRTPPPAPVGVNLKLVEVSPAPRDPARIAGSNDTFTLTGLNGAIVNGDRVRLYSDAALTNQLALLATDSNGAFPATALPYNAAERYYAQALDPAGNPSASATTLSLPQPSAFTASPSPGRAGAPLTIGFTTSVTLSQAPVVQVDGNAAACGAPSGLTYSCTYTPAGTEPEGANAAVVRVYARDGSGAMAPATEGTAAITTTLDFHAPTLAGGQVAVTQSNPGTADAVSGAAGAVADNLAAATAVTVSVYKADGTTLISQVAARADGSFGPVAIGDNTNAGVVVKLADPAGNVSAGAPFSNDVAPPAITGLAASPAAQHAGADVTVGFTVTDDAHDLRAAPAVTVAGNAATLVSGTLNTSDGQPHAFTYRYTVRSTDAEQVHPVQVSLTDGAGNPQSASTSVIIDRTSPSSANTTPGNKATWNGSPGALGTASDALSGVAKVEVSLKSVSNGQWWNGSSFGAATETWLTAVGTTSWSFSMAGIPFVSAQSYVMRWRATDAAGNVETPGAGWTFAYDATLPPAPATLTATPNGELRVDLAWGAVSGAASYKIYYDTEGGVRPPYAGTGSILGPSPVTVTGTTSFYISGIARGRWVFAVTAVDSSGRESGYSPQAAAASRAWKWSNGGMTTNTVNRIITTGPGNYVAVGDAGTVWISNDGGATWRLKYGGAVGDLFDIVKSTAGLVAVGTAGIAFSADGGDTWTTKVTQALGRNRNTAAYAAGNKVVVAAGSPTSSVQYSADGGATWSVVATTLTSAVQVIAGSGLNVVAFSSAGVGRSADGGATWSAATTTAGSFNTAYLNGNLGVAGGLTGKLVITTNGGASWAPPAAGSPVFSDVTLVFGSGSLVFALSNDGTYARSTDTGATWTTSPGHAVNQFAGWTDGTLVIAAGVSNGYTRSTNGGQTWLDGFNVPGPSDETDPWRVWPWAMASDGTTVVVGGNGLARSADQGVSYRTAPQLSVPAKKKIWMSGTRLAVPSNGQVGVVALSSDGGDTWTYAHPPYNSMTMAGGDASAVLIGGFDATSTPVLARSTDFGQTFTTVASLPSGPRNFNDVAVAGSTWIVVCGTGHVLRSIDGGLTWPDQRLLTGTALNAVKYLGSNTFLTYGAGGKIFRSTDLGVNWSQVTSPTTSELVSDFVPGGIPLVLLIATNGQVLSSGNNGATFTIPGATGLGVGNTVWGSMDGVTFLAAGGGGDKIVGTTNAGVFWSQVRFVANTNVTYAFGPYFAPNGSFYYFGTGPIGTSVDGTTWSDVVPSHVTPVPVGPRSVFTNGYVSPAGMPFTLSYGGAMVFGPP